MKNQTINNIANKLINASKMLNDYDLQLTATKKSYNSELEIIHSIKPEAFDYFEQVYNALIELVPVILDKTHDEQIRAILDYQNKYQQQIKKIYRDKQWKNIYDLYFIFITKPQFSGNNSFNFGQQFINSLQKKFGTNDFRYLLFRAYLIWREYRDLKPYYVE